MKNSLFVIFAFCSLCLNIVLGESGKNHSKAATPIPKIQKKKKDIKDQLPDYDSKMQALTGCYFIFEKIINEHSDDFVKFIQDNSLNKTELYLRVRLDHISKCLAKIGEYNISRVLENVADHTVPSTFYEKSGLMKWDLKKYKNGNFSTNLSSTDEILLTFINEIDETVINDEQKMRDGEKIQVFESEKANKIWLYVSLTLILCIFALVIYYLTKNKDKTKKIKKDKKEKKNK